ncbi:MAG TPA: DUF2244 domain-containing protein [Burkholderiales bacterium]
MVSALDAQALAGPDAVEFEVRRNCSLSPRALMGVFGSMAGLAFVFGAAFAAMGAWMVLPFAGVELLALAAAFLLYGVHATDGERVSLAGEVLRVEVSRGRAIHTYEFARHAVRLVREARAYGLPGRADRLFLVGGGRRLEVGRHLGYERRAGFETDLRAALMATRET